MGRMFLFLMLLFLGTQAAADASIKRPLYFIGNSLTGTLSPERLEAYAEGSVGYHRVGGATLAYIFENPDAPSNSTEIWPEAFANGDYGTLVLQPHIGDTVEGLVAVISHWSAMQPNADVLIHTGWSPEAQWEEAYHAETVSEVLVHSPEWFEHLMAELIRAGIPVRGRLMSIDILDSIFHDIENATAPYADFGELYIDTIHMTPDGHFLQHNMLRSVLGEPYSAAYWPDLSEAKRQYLLAKIDELELVPAPSIPARVYTVAPCRVVDTRGADAFLSNFSGSKLAAGETVHFHIVGNAIEGQGGAADCGVPPEATGVFANVVVVSPEGSSDSGWLTLYAYGDARSGSSTINFQAETAAVANGVLVSICGPAQPSCDYDLTVNNAPRLDAHLIIDVTGYLAE